MLILDRRIGQQIVMNNGKIQLKVLKVEDGIISIGIDAPDHMDIDREEVYLRKMIRRNIAMYGGESA